MAEGQQAALLNYDQNGMLTSAYHNGQRWHGNEQLIGALAVAATLQSAAAANGNGTLADVASMATALLDIQGTFAATINFEGSVDDTAWYPLMATRLADGLLANTATAGGLYRLDVAGLKSVRARISGYASGTATVKARLTPLEAAPRSVLAQVTGRKLALATGNYNQVLNVAAGGNTIITITPPAGELWRIKSLYIEIPAPTSSTTGTHSVRLYYYTDIADSILEAKSTFNTLIWVSGQLLKSSTSSKFPALDADAQRAILNHVATNAVPLKLRYYNGTDVAQTGTALITVVREVEYIA